MRSLVRPRPEVNIPQAEMVAVEGEGTGLRPGPDDEIVRLVETLVREEWINTQRIIFRADAAHEPGNDPPLRQIVEHRKLFRDVDRVVHQRQGAAEDCDLDFLGALDERAGD